jgi:hypothetical protein
MKMAPPVKKIFSWGLMMDMELLSELKLEGEDCGYIAVALPAA